MIVTVTLNPSLHVRYDSERVELGASNRVSRVRHQVGGRGLAVAQLLRTFGHDVVAAGLAGGSAGDLIRTELAKTGVATQFTRISAESRRVLQVTDASGVQTAFDEPAPYITTEELGRLAADYRALLDGATAVVLCGSLPAGLPAETYGSLTSYAVEAGVPVVLDAGGTPLRYGAARGPALVIPDLTAGELLPELADAGSVVLPADGGVRVLTASGEWLAGVGACQAGPGPRPAAGFRDALVAGFVPGIALAWSWPDMLRHAVALAAAVSQDGVPDLGAYEALLPQVTVTGPRG
ncbi:MAG TPA: PfkB family carbohydrate kinase [Streptosporangiaceae bacterium]|nr:PfkB family carbohydrate kinase [Streptosporangiaceae bacterium]